MDRSEPQYRLAGHVQLTVIDETAIVLDGASGKYLGLNEVGTRVLELVRSGRNHQTEIVRALLGEFDVSEETAQSDVEALLRELEERRLIERSVSTELKT